MMMKKYLSSALALLMAASLLAGCGITPGSSESTFSDEMKLPYTCDLDESYGADSIERDSDHADSPYYTSPDFYNMESTESLTILSHFQTQQQTCEWSCGVSCALMVLHWYGLLGDYNEESLAQFRSNRLTPEATSMSQLVDIFEGVGGFDLYSVLDCGEEAAGALFTPEFIQQTLQAGKPIIVGWNDWGGHWQIIIGYDTMGTDSTMDDVVIMADPYDTTDHNQDGYGTYSAERFLSNFSFYDYFDEASGEPNDYCFLIATPKA